MRAFWDPVEDMLTVFVHVREHLWGVGACAE